MLDFDLRAPSRRVCASSSALLRSQLARRQALLARQVAPGLRELHLRLAEGRLGGAVLRLRLLELRALRGAVQVRQDLAGAHVIAFLDEHVGDGAGDLRGNRGFATRSHVAGGLQHGPPARERRCRRRHFHGRMARGSQQPHRHADRQQQARRNCGGQQPATRRRDALALSAVEVQHLQQLLFVRGAETRGSLGLRAIALAHGSVYSWSTPSGITISRGLRQLDDSIEHNHRRSRDLHGTQRLALSEYSNAQHSGPVHVVTLAGDEARPGVVRHEQAQLKQISTEHGEGIAAERVLRDADTGTEHASLGLASGYGSARV